MRVEIEVLRKRFGGILALEDVTVEFPEGWVTAIMGPNGAGKTTLLNIIAGFLRPDSGAVQFIEETDSDRKTGQRGTLGARMNDLLDFAPHERAAQGLGILFQDVRVFKNLSALANVVVGAKNQPGEVFWRCFLQYGAVREHESQVVRQAHHLLRTFGLDNKANIAASQLSYGEQKLVAFARLLANDSKVLLLDEPTAGLHTVMIEKMLSFIQKAAHQEGRTVIMIEHNLEVVRRYADWVYLLAAGRIEAFGKPEETLTNAALASVFNLN